MKIGIDARASKWYRETGIGTYSYQSINSLNKIHNYNDYLLVNPYDVNDLSEKMYTMFLDNSLRQSLRIKGFKRVSELTWEHTTADTLTAYKNILLNK